MLTETRIKKCFSLAEHASLMSDFDGRRKIKIGSVLIYKNKVVSVGWNTSKTSPIQAEYNKLRNFDPYSNAKNTCHSEMLCLCRAKNLNIDWSKVALFVFRRKRDGTLGNAKPCKACDAYIRSFGIKNIYYTTDNGWTYEHLDY